MSEPVRWRDDPEAASDVRDLLAGAASTRAMPSEARTRSAARVAQLASSPPGAGLSLASKAALGFGAIVITVAALKLLLSRHEVTPPAAVQPNAADPVSPPSAPLGTTTAARPPAAESAAEPIGAPPTASVRAPRRAPSAEPATATSAAPTDTLAREAAMLEAARALLDTRPAEALATLDAHAAEFPAGQLAAERELLAVRALAKLGRVTEARSRGQALLTRSRESPYEPRVRALLASLDRGGDR